MRKRLLKKCIAGVITAGMLLSTCVPAGQALADDTTAPKEGVTTDAGDDEVSDNTPTELQDVNGRISYWEWERLTNDNVRNLLNDNEFHAAMFVKAHAHYSERTVTFDQGFISIYGDKEHLFLGPANTSTELTKLKDQTSAGCYPQFIFGYDEYTALQMKEDPDGQLLNDHQDYFTQDKFISQGGPMGVFFIRARSFENDTSHKTQSGHDITVNGHTGSEGYHGPCTWVDMDLAICRSSCKTDPGDMSYLDIGTGQDQKLDYFLEPHYANRDGQKDEANLSFSHTGNGNRFHLTVFRHDPGFKLWVIDSYLKENEGEGYTNLVSCNGWTSQVDVEDTQAVDGDDDNTYNAWDRFNGSFNNAFEVYIGKQYVFSTLKGEKNPDFRGKMDETTGAGGILNVEKDTVLSVGETFYPDRNGKTQKSDGCVIPETSVVKVKEGGVLSVDGALINNGKIIIDGGTMIIRDNGSVAPYGQTSEGTIECMNGGTIIIMPNGRLFSVPNNDNVPDVSLTGGSVLVNYGLWVNHYAQVDGSSKVEVRCTDSSTGILYPAASRTDFTYLFLKNKRISAGSFDMTNLKKENDPVTDNYLGIRGMYPYVEDSNFPDRIAGTTDNGVIILDKKAEMNNMSDNGLVDYTAFINVQRLEY